MKSEIQIHDRADLCRIEIEGTIGVPEEWQFETPDSRVATYERFRGDARAHRPDREPGSDRRNPLDGRRRERRPADSRRPPGPSGTYHHPLLRIHGLGRDDHRTGRIARMPRDLGQRPLPDPQLDLRLGRQRRGARRKGRAAPADRRPHRRALRRPVGPSGRGNSKS